jgi:hypothetical protein
MTDRSTADAELVAGGAHLGERRNPAMSGNYRNDPRLNDSDEFETGDGESFAAEHDADAEDIVVVG